MSEPGRDCRLFKAHFIDGTSEARPSLQALLQSPSSAPLTPLPPTPVSHTCVLQGLADPRGHGSAPFASYWQSQLAQAPAEPCTLHY